MFEITIFVAVAVVVVVVDGVEVVDVLNAAA